MSVFENTEEKRIGVLTSGGDAPGMNAALRAVVRSAEYAGHKMIGIKKGYVGLINSEFIEMNARSVSDIIHRGGTILRTARSPELMTKEGQKKAANIYKALKLDALVVIGGDGSFRGARDLRKFGVNSICIPATIDLDISSTEYSIGFDTAVNTAMDAINKIRDTGYSHERCSVVEVMGRNAGYLALWCAVTGGAEDVVFPEMFDKNDMASIEDEVLNVVLYQRSKGKRHSLIIVAEGVGKADAIAKHVQSVTGIDTRSTILGYLQRGGSPTALDRMHASMMGHMAVELISGGAQNRVIAYKKGEYVDYDLDEALEMKKNIDFALCNVVKVLSV